MRTQEVLDRFPELSYRQLNVWTTLGYLGDDRKQTGQGRHREYDVAEVAVLERMLSLVQAGVRPEVASKIARGGEDAIVPFRALSNALEGCIGV